MSSRTATRARPSARRGPLLAVVLAIVTALGAAPLARAAPEQDRVAQVQAVLDRVLGPGRSVVEIADTVRTGAVRTTTLRYGSGVPAATSTQVWSSPAGSGLVQSGTSAVSSTSTSTITPAGALVRQTVAVAVDRAALGTTPVPALKRLIAAAAAIVPSRGDRLSLVVTRFAAVRAVPAAQSSWTAALLPAAVPAMWIAGGVAALAVLLLPLRGPRGRRLRRS